MATLLLATSLDLETFSQAANIVLAVVTLWLTWIALKFTAKPRVAATLIDARRFVAGEPAVLTFRLWNKGHLYGKPPATDTKVWVNLDPQFAPIKLRYGSSFQREDTTVKRGKAGSKYLKASGIVLTGHEEGEEIELTTVMPRTPGRYNVRLAIHTAEGGTSNYNVAIEAQPKQLRAVPLRGRANSQVKTARDDLLREARSKPDHGG